MIGRARALALLTVTTVVAASGLALAVAPPRQSVTPVARPVLETAHGAPVRPHREVSWNQVPQRMVRPWSRLLGATGASWQASWDQATGVPSRLFGRGVPAANAVASASAAERHARAFLTDHIDLLAPGAFVADFVLVSNVRRRDMRILGFRQTHAGMEVLGGQVSFRYKNDRLFVVASQALPNLGGVAVPGPAFLASRSAAAGFARSWVLADASFVASAGQVDGPFILPLVGPGGVREYRVVHRVDVSARQPVGLYYVYTDAMTGGAVAREQRLRFAEGAVRFQVPIRRPSSSRQAFPAKLGSFTIDGSPAQSNEAGQVAWPGTTSADLTVRPQGPLVRVTNSVGAAATAAFPIDPGETVTWSASNDELVEAQLSAFVHAGVVKEFAAQRLAPDLAWLQTQLPVNVNIDENCNAFSDGNSINFFQSNGQCANTGLLADVIYHEFGHSLHANSLIEGVGSFDGAHSEGLSDYLAATITGDPGMGRGFFHNDGPLRHIDPSDREHIWPRDIAEIHYTGLIFGGAMWDLRKLLVQQHGEEDGAALADRLFYATLERATDIPSTYVEVLAEDDDDGDLSNGTPNVCDINAAFGMHGLRALSAELAPMAAELPGEGGFPVSLRVAGLFPQCPGDGLASASIDWEVRGQTPSAPQIVPMSEGEDGARVGMIPPVEAGSTVRYKLQVEFLDGSVRAFPDNPADPRYEFHAGEVVPLYCTDFESDPFAEGWSHGLASGADEEGADDWAWGVPMGPPQSGDPLVAFSGDKVLGNDLGGGDYNGKYQPDKVNYAAAPKVDVGTYSDVRIQYWRWLTVEDAFFDRATIYANGEVAWRNFNSEQGNSSATQHMDREWRFQDVPVSQFIVDGNLDVKFEIASDGGLEFGGWTVDDYCVVAAAGSICGDGVISGAETCDEGDANSDSEPDACREHCRAAACGDGVVDGGETCDDGNLIDGDGCNSVCGADGGGGDCGCRVAPRRRLPGIGALLLLAFAGVALAWSRRRRPDRAR